MRLRTGESERKEGGYCYRWTDDIGKRHAVYAPTLNDLREQEEQIAADRHDGIKANARDITVNDMFDLWCQIKRGIKDSTFKNYIYGKQVCTLKNAEKAQILLYNRQSVLITNAVGSKNVRYVIEAKPGGSGNIHVKAGSFLPKTMQWN